MPNSLCRRKSAIIIAAVAATVLAVAALIVFVIIPGIVEHKINSWIERRSWISAENIGKVKYSLLRNTVSIGPVVYNFSVDEDFNSKARLTIQEIRVSGLPVGRLVAGDIEFGGKMETNSRLVLSGLDFSSPDLAINVSELLLAKPHIVLPEGLGKQTSFTVGMLESILRDSTVGVIQLNNVHFRIAADDDVSAAGQLKELRMVSSSPEIRDLQIKEAEIYSGKYSLSWQNHEMRNIRYIGYEGSAQIKYSFPEMLFSAMPSHKNIAILYDESSTTDLIVCAAQSRRELARIDNVVSRMKSPFDFSLQMSRLTIPSSAMAGSDELFKTLGYERMVFDLSLSLKWMDNLLGDMDLEENFDIVLHNGGQLKMQVRGKIPEGAGKYESAYKVLLSGGKVSYADNSFLERLFLYMAHGDRNRAEQKNRQYIKVLRGMAALSPEGTGLSLLSKGLAEFLANPGQIVVEFAIPEATPLDMLFLQAIFNYTEMLNYVSSVVVTPPSASSAKSSSAENPQAGAQ